MSRPLLSAILSPLFNPRSLDKLIEQLTKGNNKKGPDLQFINALERTRYVQFLRRAVKYLPDLIPEKLVWRDDAAKTLFGADLPQNILTESNYKQRLYLLASQPGLDADAAFKYLLSRFLKSEVDDRKFALMRCIQEIRNSSS